MDNEGSKLEKLERMLEELKKLKGNQTPASHSGPIKTETSETHSHTIFYPNGRIKYHGGWKDNKQHGEGTYYYPNGNLQYQGSFENGQYTAMASCTTKQLITIYTMKVCLI